MRGTKPTLSRERRRQLAEALYVAFKKQSMVLEAMQDVYIMHAVGVMITPTELDELPQNMLERYLLLKAVVNVAENGGVLKL